MTRDWFDQQLARLSVLKNPPATSDGHWDTLNDIPEGVFEAAIGYALKTREWFPVPAELRVDADHVAPLAALDEPLPIREHVLDQPFSITVPGVGTVVSVTREWRYYCEDCSDTGWRALWCGDEQAPQCKPWQAVLRCQRRGDHDPHEWVQHCACYESNPALVRKREAQRKYAESPRKVA